MLKCFVPVVGLLALASCSSPSAGTAADIAAAESSLTAIERVATIYVNLPPCGVGAPTVCSNPTTVAKIRSLDQQAYTAVKAVENHAGTIEAALTAIANLQSIIPGV